MIWWTFCFLFFLRKKKRKSVFLLSGRCWCLRRWRPYRPILVFAKAFKHVPNRITHPFPVFPPSGSFLESRPRPSEKLPALPAPHIGPDRPSQPKLYGINFGPCEFNQNDSSVFLCSSELLIFGSRNNSEDRSRNNLRKSCGSFIKHCIIAISLQKGYFMHKVWCLAYCQMNFKVRVVTFNWLGLGWVLRGREAQMMTFAMGADRIHPMYSLRENMTQNGGCGFHSCISFSGL